MGFLRVKSVKGHQYVYWCNRVRSRKKHGGNGKVKSPDFLLGNSIVRGKYLAFYFHTGDVPVREYAEAAIAYVLENKWCAVVAGVKLKASDSVAVEIGWHTKPKLCLQSKDKHFDCRRKDWREVRQKLQEYLKAILKASESVQEHIELTAFFLAQYEECTKLAQVSRNNLQEYRKNPAKTWTEWESEKDIETGQWERREVEYSWKADADIILDEAITAYDTNSLQVWDKYQQSLNQVISYAPRKRQEDFKRTILSQTEKLAKDARWVERYNAVLAP